MPLKKVLPFGKNCKDFKYIKENVRRRESQESHEYFFATFQEKVAGSESHEDLKIKYC